jgi:circadian clock protein KaiB
MEDNKIETLIIEGKLVLKLYVAGMSQKSMEAIENINSLCDKHLKGFYDLEIIDIYKNPKIAEEQQIIFSPSLIKKSPFPKRTLVGTLSDTKKVLNALGITLDK